MIIGSYEELKEWGLLEALPLNVPTHTTIALVRDAFDFDLEGSNWDTDREYSRCWVVSQADLWVEIMTEKCTVSTNLRTTEHSIIRATCMKSVIRTNATLLSGSIGVAVAFVGKSPDNSLEFQEWHDARRRLPKVIFDQFGRRFPNQAVSVSRQNSLFFRREEEAVAALSGDFLIKTQRAEIEKMYQS